MHDRRKNPFTIAAWIVGGVTMAVFFAFVFGYFVMLLWNWLMPDIFELPVITYWQAVGIIILARLLIGGMGHNKHEKHKKFKRKFECSEEFKREAEDWRYYHEYWKDEGEEAFKEYLKKKKEEQND